MKLYGMTNQLQQLRSAEIRLQRDFTEQAVQVIAKRLDTINQGEGTEEQKQRERDRAFQVFAFTMGREVPANG